MTKNANRIDPVGVILYEGPSAIDGAPIVVVATFFTRNAKTGPMVQTWILRQDVEPHEAITTGQDSSVCGACPLRGSIDQEGHNRGRGCYVEVYQAPLQVHRAWRRGVYPQYNPAQHAHLFAGRGLRLGSYGDPAAAPYRIWRPIVAIAARHTGYTHQWRTGRFWRFKGLLMASTHSVEESAEANARGWRTFRTASVQDGEQLAPAAGEIVCPASAEGGYSRTCDTCSACRGGDPRRVSIVIGLHGSRATLASARRAVG